MGREIRRVALEFGWPLGTRWKGFVNPHYEGCPVCKDSGGYSDTYLLLDGFTRHLLIAAEASAKRPDDYVPIRDGGRSMGFLRFGGIAPPEEQPRQWPWDTDPVDVMATIAGEKPREHDAWVIRRLARLNKHPGMWSPQMARYDWSVDEEGNRVRKVVLNPEGGMYYPHPYLVEDYGISDVGTTFHEFVRKLGGKPGMLGWDGGWDIRSAVLKAHGYEMPTDHALPDDLLCPFCKGSGVHPDASGDYENWEPYDPPKGEGYQLWNTTTEGHPMSPVFDTPEKLATWLVKNKISTFGVGNTMSYDQWMRFIEGPGWAPSMVGNSATGELVTGAEFVAGEGW
jgi:hypothetical protein